jgi:DNA-binding MarR family transcriptional regulator
MPALLLKDVPRFECLLEYARHNPDLDPSALVAYLHLLRASDIVFAAADRNFTGFGLSHGRFGVLILLFRKEQARGKCPEADNLGRTPADLAAAAGVSRATMTGLIDTLERDGLVTRQPDEQDRRMMVVKLTDQGRERLSRLLPIHFQTVAELIAPLNEAERQTFVELLSRIRDPRAAASEPVAVPVPTILSS